MHSSLRPGLIILTLLLMGGFAGFLQLGIRKDAHAFAVRQNLANETALEDPIPATPPPRARLGQSQQRAFLWLLGASFLAILTVALLPSRKPDAPAAPRPNDPQGTGPIEYLARATAAQAEVLERERLTRQRTEETLHLKQVLLNRSLEEKIKLGRDLHDGLIQTLYASGLALESARTHLRADPEKAETLLARGIRAINTAIQDARHAIESLAPDQVRRGNFQEAVESVLALLNSDRLQTLDLQLPQALALRIPNETQAELLQIIREAVSNALRHGHASEISVCLTPQGDALLSLEIRDNGRGFNPRETRRHGHGLDNLSARAANLSGQLSIESRIDKGTRIHLTFPATVPTVQ